MSAVVQPQHHPKLYYDDGNFVSDSKSSILYCLHKGILSKHSHAFHSTFLEPYDTSKPRDGDDNTHPFALSPALVTPIEFNYLVTYLMCGPSSYPSHDDEPERYKKFLLSVLDVSSLLQIEDQVIFSIHVFEQLGDSFDPIQHIELACRYSINDWIAPGVQQLLKVPLFLMQARIETLHTALAFRVPKVVNNLHCGVPAACSSGWEYDWWNGVAHQLLHPDLQLSGQDVLKELTMTQMSGICELCQERTVKWIEEKGTLVKEDEYIMKTVTALVEWHECGQPAQLSITFT
ncbi:hypothetical protein BDQ17DRAFT_1433381 [Cyathus striatus]|nr:hypothetical protein BDQ17DRAFT_1433381 [Cyathus striatus]